MTDTIDLKALERQAAQMVEAAIKKGADACDVVVAHGQSLSSVIRDGMAETSNRSEGDGVSLRVFVGNRVASVSADQISEVDMLAERAVTMAKVSPEDPYACLAPKERLVSTNRLNTKIAALDMFDNAMPDSAALEEQARAAEDAGLAVTGVSKSMGSSASWGTSGFVLATSTGFTTSFNRSRFGVSAAMVGGEGTAMERDYDYSSSVHLEDLQSPQSVGQKAGENVVRRMNPRQVKSCSVPIVFDKRVSGSILGSLMSAVNASSIARKTSFLRNEMGNQVTSNGITIVDDPAMVRGLGSKPVDGEGVDNPMLELVSNGVLNDWVLDCATAQELGLETNGRASRSGAGTSPSTTNCYIKPGTVSAEELIGDIKNGFFLTETIGHGVNMVTGDFSKGASGFWIENGEITYPVAEITIAGNLQDMYQNMIAANDLEFKGAMNAPSLLINGMTVGGK